MTPLSVPPLSVPDRLAAIEAAIAALTERVQRNQARLDVVDTRLAAIEARLPNRKDERGEPRPMLGEKSGNP